MKDPLEFELGDKVTEGIENDLFVEDKLEKNIVGEITPRLNKSIPIEVSSFWILMIIKFIMRINC